MTTTEEFLSKTETLLSTQDNACTADPIFVVQQRERFFGVDPDYCEALAYVQSHDDDPVTLAEQPERFARFKRGEFDEDEDGDAEAWALTGYVDRWVFVQPFLTLEAAETYRKRQAHNHSETRVYVDSGYRNPEWQQLRAMLMEGHALNAIRLADVQAEQLRAANTLIARYREAARGGAEVFRNEDRQTATYHGYDRTFVVSGAPVTIKDGDTLEGGFPLAVEPLVDDKSSDPSTRPCPATMCRNGKTGDGWDCTWCKGTGRVPIHAVFPTGATYHGPARMLINGIPVDLKDGDTIELNSPRTCAAVLALADKAHVLADWIDDQTKPGAYARSLEVSLRRLAGAHVPKDIADPAGSRCDPEIYEKGVSLFVFQAPKNLAEAWVRRVAAESGERVDWHYVAGRALVRYLGERAKVRAAIEKLLPELRTAVKIHNHSAYGISNIGGEAGNGDTGYFLEENP